MAQIASVPETGTNKDLLQRRYDEAEHKFREAADKADHLAAQVKTERQAIEELNIKYDAACRRFASGEAAEIAPIVAERDRRSDRLRGLESLYNEASAAVKPLHDANVGAARALQEELDRLELARLDAAITDAKATQNAAQTALNEAGKALTAVVWARSEFLRKRDNMTRREHLEAQGRA